MIFDFILNLYIDIYYDLMEGIPYAVFPDGWLDVFATIQATIGQLQTLFPVVEGLALVAVVIFIDVAVTVFKMGNSLFTKVRGSG